MLDGIIDDIIDKSQHATTDNFKFCLSENSKYLDVAKTISKIENEGKFDISLVQNNTPVFGITGTGGAGKSSLIDELLLRFNRFNPEFKIALISVDPTRKKSQGALLGDRIRLGSASFDQFFVRSLATRNSKNELSPQISSVVNFLKTQAFDLIIVETSGIGQASDEITSISDFCAYVMTPEYGASSQLEKIEMLARQILLFSINLRNLAAKMPSGIYKSRLGARKGWQQTGFHTLKRMFLSSNDCIKL